MQIILRKQSRRWWCGFQSYAVCVETFLYVTATAAGFLLYMLVMRLRFFASSAYVQNDFIGIRSENYDNAYEMPVTVILYTDSKKWFKRRKNSRYDYVPSVVGRCAGGWCYAGRIFFRAGEFFGWWDKAAYIYMTCQIFSLRKLPGITLNNWILNSCIQFIQLNGL